MQQSCFALSNTTRKRGAKAGEGRVSVRAMNPALGCCGPSQGEGAPGQTVFHNRGPHAPQIPFPADLTSFLHM